MTMTLEHARRIVANESYLTSKSVLSPPPSSPDEDFWMDLMRVFGPQAAPAWLKDSAQGSELSPLDDFRDVL